MSWDIGAFERNATAPVPPPPPPTPAPTDDIYIRLKPGGRLNNVKITRRKTNISHDVLITVNKDTTVKWEIIK